VQFGNLAFYDLNIIFNVLHPSNHSQTSTNFTLNSLICTSNQLKVKKISFTL